MKVLWICNVPIPEAKEVMGDETQVRVSWLVGISNALRKKVDLYIGYFSDINTEIKMAKGKGVTFIAIPRKGKKVNKFYANTENDIVEVYNQVKPDVVHIFGTEFPHTLSAVNASETMNMLDKTVVSIQGLVSICGQHYLASLPEWATHFYTIRDILRHCNIKGAQREFLKRGKYEIEALKKAKHVIGRTDWDYACATMINPNITYHFNNEILRESFYKNEWQYEQCEKHRIFMSQGGVPYKGFHFALEALALLKKKYPDVKLCITERDFVHAKGIKEKIRLNSYQYYLKKLIMKYDLVESICFLGTLTEEEMCQQYLKANVYILPSTIENSPNSLGEAMLVGTPVISADVGGVKNMLQHEEEGYVYPHDDPYMLASYIEKQFENIDVYEKMSHQEKEHAKKIFDVNKNIDCLVRIYKKLGNKTTR